MCQQSNALTSAADPLRDLASSQPVVIGLDPEHPSADAGTLDVDDGGDHGILPRWCFAVEQTQDGTVRFHGERAVVAAASVSVGA